MNLQVNLSVEFGSEKYAERWEFGLRKVLIKAEMDNFE